MPAISSPTITARVWPARRFLMIFPRMGIAGSNRKERTSAAVWAGPSASTSGVEPIRGNVDRSPTHTPVVRAGQTLGQYGVGPGDTLDVEFDAHATVGLRKNADGDVGGPPRPADDGARSGRRRAPH